VLRDTSHILEMGTGWTRAMNENDVGSDPAMARAKDATARAWRALEDEWGLFDEDEVTDLLAEDERMGSVENLRERGELLGVHRGGRYLCPGFQFDRRGGSVRPWVAPLLTLARESRRSAEDVALRMIGPTPWIVGPHRRPVDHISDTPMLLDVARNAWDSEW